MAPRPASGCCRAMRSHLTSSSSTSTSTSTTTLDSIWITDSVLASAFARYCRTFSFPASTGTTYRFASNVPGPLESRRRLGKRQMTDQLNMQLSLNPVGSILPPAWALPNASDLRQWQWSPPRDASESLSLLSRQVDTAKSGSTSMFPSLGMPKWLADLGGEVAEVEAVEESAETRRSITANHLFAKLQDWRDSCHTLSETEFARQLDHICSEFQTQLSLAALTIDEAREIFASVWDGLNEKEDSLQTYAPMLYAAVLEGIGACRLLQASDFGVDFWRELFVRVSRLLPSNNSSSPLTASMALDTLLATPPQFLTKVMDLLPPHLCIIFANHAMSTRTITNTAAEDSHALTHTHTHTHAEMVAQALQHIDLDQHGGFIDATTELLIVISSSGSSGSADDGIPAKNHITTTSSTAPGWLFTLAHMPQVRQDCLFKTMSQLQSAAQTRGVETMQADTRAQTAQRETATTAINSSSAWYMRSADLCELLLAQWISRGYVTQQAQRSFQRTMQTMPPMAAMSSSGQEGYHPAALAALALAVFRSKHSRPRCVALYVSLLRALRTLGRDAAADELVPSVAALLAYLQTTQHTQSLPPAAFFESLAWAADDVQTAVRLHELYVSTGVARLDSFGAEQPPQPLWSVGFWDKFADRLAAALDEGLLSPGQVSHALDLSARLQAAKTIKAAAKATKTKTKAPYKLHKSLGAPTVALVEKLAVHFALAPNLVPRRALRGVEQCRAFLFAHGRRQAGKSFSQEPQEPAAQEFVNSFSHSSPSSASSPTVLRALFHLITRDLEEAQPGRTTRLRWFLDIVEREHSPAVALSSGRALTRWREAAKRYRKAEDRRVTLGEKRILDREG